MSIKETGHKQGRLCSYPGCTLPHKARSFCNPHYRALLRKGRPDLRERQDRVKRFWELVEKTDGCWLWKASRFSGKGYGQYKVGDKNVRAHRFSYELTKGTIPEGLTIDHLCRVQHCVNPDHLEAVPMLVNIARKPRASVCKRGHVREPNTRRCKVCSNKARAGRQPGARRLQYLAAKERRANG